MVLTNGHHVGRSVVLPVGEVCMLLCKNMRITITETMSSLSLMRWIIRAYVSLLAEYYLSYMLAIQRNRRSNMRY